MHCKDVPRGTSRQAAVWKATGSHLLSAFCWGKMQWLTAGEHLHSPNLQCRALVYYFTSAWFEGACSGVGLAPWPLLNFLVYLAAVSHSGWSTGTCTWLHSTVRCFSHLEVPLKWLHRSPFSHSQGHVCNSHIANFFVSLTAMGSLESVPMSSKQRGVEREKVHSSLATTLSSFSAALSLLCLCRIQIHLTLPCSFRKPVFHAKPSQRVSAPSCQDGIPWKLFLLFISQKKYNTVLFYWRDTATDNYQPEILYLKKPEYFQVQVCPLPIFLVLQSHSTLFSFCFAINYLPRCWAKGLHKHWEELPLHKLLSNKQRTSNDCLYSKVSQDTRTGK